jgi:hypothetical protein
MPKPRIRADFHFHARTLPTILVAGGILFLLLWFGVASSQAVLGQSTAAVALGALGPQVLDLAIVLLVLGIAVAIFATIFGRRRSRSY